MSTCKKKSDYMTTVLLYEKFLCILHPFKRFFFYFAMIFLNNNLNINYYPNEKMIAKNGQIYVWNTNQRFLNMINFTAIYQRNANQFILYSVSVIWNAIIWQTWKHFSVNLQELGSWSQYTGKSILVYEWLENVHH